MATLPDLIEGLLSPSAYDHDVDGVMLVQTHISYVLLAGAFAYKIKKPLDLAFLDYSTLEKRRLMCEEEVRLNRRLCAEAYIGVVPVVRTGAGIRIGGEGEAVEYAVKMHRMPAGRVMPAMLDHGDVTTAHVRSIARTIAAFHESSATDERIASFGRVEGVRRNWEENFAQSEPYAGGIVTRAEIDELRRYVASFLDRNGSLIEQRADEGRVRDCHGDLRAESVVIRDDGSICVMDCIEFNDRIRFGDVAADIGFLAMDLDARRRPDLADELIAAYLGDTDDETLPLVLNFYRCYRAAVRAKVEAMRSDEPEVPVQQREAAAGHARWYFDLALRYARAAHPQALVTMAGLSGTGKSFLAHAVAGRIEAVVVNSDVVRKRTLGMEPRERMWEPYGAGAYTDESHRRVYAAMHEIAREHLAAGRTVVLDATHLRRADRDAARGLARSTGVPFLAVQVMADDALVRRHFEERLAGPGSASDARWEIYVGQREHFEPPDEIHARQKLAVDSARPLRSNVERVIAAIDGLN